MDSSRSVILAEEKRVNLLARLENVLEKEEATIIELEGLLEDERQALLGSDTGHLLNVLQRTEEAAGRAAQLKAFRERLVAESGGPPGASLIATAQAMDTAASVRLLALRHRILGKIARIAEFSETNGYLIAGLTRVTGAAIDRLSQLQEAGAPEGGAGPKPAAVDTRA